MFRCYLKCSLVTANHLKQNEIQMEMMYRLTVINVDLIQYQTQTIYNMCIIRLILFKVCNNFIERSLSYTDSFAVTFNFGDKCLGNNCKKLFSRKTAKRN